MNSYIPLLVYIVIFTIAYPLLYLIFKTIEYFYGTQVVIVVGLSLVVIALIALWRLIVKLEGDK
jgi:hypothetical protein